MTIYERLNYQKDLTDQNPNYEFMVLYTSSGTHMASCVVKLNESYFVNVEDAKFEITGFFADHTTYYYPTNSQDEVYYPCAILNSKAIDNVIKPHQARGRFGGERHIHKIPLSFPIPKYDPTIKSHKELAEDGKICHGKVKNNILPKLSIKSIAKIRSNIRKELYAEFRRIENNVSALIIANNTETIFPYSVSSNTLEE